MSTPSSGQVTPHAWLQRCENPGPMTLDGTNTWVLADPRTPGHVVVIDPGPEDPEHLAALSARTTGAVEVLGLLTHGHLDHSGGISDFTAATGADLRRSRGGEADTGFASLGVQLSSEPLRDREVLQVGALRLMVLPTPGHTRDSVCLLDLDEQVLYSGDTILGRGTSVVAHPDGVLADYLDSLAAIEALVQEGSVRTIHPGHGPVLSDAAAVVEHYRRHRQERLEQVRTSLASLPQEWSRERCAEAIVQDVYADVPRAVWPAATRTVLAQLAYLGDAKS